MPCTRLMLRVVEEVFSVALDSDDPRRRKG